MVKKRMINAPDDIKVLLNNKVDILKGDIDSLKRRKLAAKGLKKD